MSLLRVSRTSLIFRFPSHLFGTAHSRCSSQVLSFNLVLCWFETCLLRECASIEPWSSCFLHSLDNLEVIVQLSLIFQKNKPVTDLLATPKKYSNSNQRLPMASMAWAKEPAPLAASVNGLPIEPAFYVPRKVLLHMMVIALCKNVFPTNP